MTVACICDPWEIGKTPGCPVHGSSAATVDEEWRALMGDDGTGHCRGCGWPLDRINHDCGVCATALCAFMDEEVDSDGQPF